MCFKPAAVSRGRGRQRQRSTTSRDRGRAPAEDVGDGRVAGGDAGRHVDVNDSEDNSGGEPRQIRLAHAFLSPT